MKIKEITRYLESLAPISSQESYDNSGLIVGNENTEVSNVLISLDCIESTVEEAIEKNCELIIAHHPIVFRGLKKLNGKNYIERTVIKAIKNDIAIYAIHTNLDNYRFGVNHEIGKRIGLKNLRVLQPKNEVLSKLICYIPHDHVTAVSQAMFDAGAGKIGDYDECGFATSGEGSFRPNESAKPFIGASEERSTVKETKFEVVCSTHSVHQVVQAMISAHPYEEVAYEIFPMLNSNPYEGSGMVGELETPVKTEDFLKHLKREFQCGVIRHTDLVSENIQKVAYCGGAGSFLLPSAKRSGADIFITGDYKYHEFFDADGGIIIADIGHFESEQYTSHRIAEILMEKFATFAVHLTEVNTNPINYF
ncbi:MAG: Nif3-like dinuclear metal center hexameric protein [bacterium]|nr:Nif3-like dinuclear metal center hexameric protein [bacterium]